jgi:SOUL heme-binding protein
MKLLILLLVVVVLWSVWGYFASRAESAVYTVLEKKSGYEIRLYASHILAQTETNGDYDASMNNGFRIIAGYIFGGNTQNKQVAMTVPVVTQDNIALSQKDASQKIAMTVPVLTSSTEGSKVMSLVMPKGSTLQNLPTPNDARVKLLEVPETRKAALRFSWYRSQANIESHKAKLQNMLTRDGIAVGTTTPEFATYNGPGTPPWMQRHEILITLP